MEGAHHFEDLVVNESQIYVTDIHQKAIYAIDRRSKIKSVFVQLNSSLSP